MVSLSYYPGWMHDCDSLTGWSETELGSAGSVSVLYGDIFDLHITSASGDKTYLWSNDDDLGLSSNTFKKFLFRYKTSDSSIKAMILLVFTGAEGTQIALPETSNMLWTFGSIDITPDKTIDHVYLYANQATGHVYYDFALIYASDYVLPNVTGRVEISDINRYADIPIPGRVGDISQYLGAELETIRVTGDMELGDWDTPKGDTLQWLYHYMKDMPWVWFSCDDPKRNYKVTLRSYTPHFEGGADGKDRYALVLKEYRLSDAGNEHWCERFGT